MGSIFETTFSQIEYFYPKTRLSIVVFAVLLSTSIIPSSIINIFAILVVVSIGLMHGATDHILYINSDVAEGDLLRADLEQGKDDLTIQVIKGGLLTMPEGAEEALSGAQTAPKKKPSDSAKKPKKRATKKKDDNQGEMPTDSEA